MILVAKKKAPDPQDVRHKHKPLGLRPNTRLMAALRDLAKRNRRTLTAELEIAVERHLEAAGLFPLPPLN